MRKIFAAFFLVIMTLSLTACSTSQTTITDTSAVPESSDKIMKNLIVYFSMPDNEVDDSTVTINGETLGNTQYMANIIHENINADIFRITPKNTYPTDHDELIELAKEEQNNNTRPEIENIIKNFDDYDTIFIGYPNWWGDMPMILYTFFDTYDFSNKTIIPFNTHGGSGFSETINTIKELEPNADIKDGLSISRDDIQDSEQDIINWLKELGFENIEKITDITTTSLNEISISDSFSQSNTNNLTETTVDNDTENQILLDSENYDNLEDENYDNSEDENILTQLADENIDNNQDTENDITEQVSTIQTEIIDDKPHILVAYFSRTGENYGVGIIEKGNTHIIADMIAEEVGADTFEIARVTPYPEAYRECTDEAQEEKNANARPELTATVDNFDDYDIIFLGYPNWWGDMPMPVYTFIESYNFSDKTVIPFCTHAGSGLSGTVKTLQNKLTNTTVLDGFAIAGTTAQNSQDEAKEVVIEWLNGIEILK